MNKPDLTAMSRKELHDYFMTHRDDEEAFNAYVDKLHSEGNWREMPALKSLDDLNQYPDFVKRFPDIPHR
ncbi:MAG: hypothetical protein N5P05_002168 [Chroococcopsis gigantea SAG 12.99]|jgi:hypothetical protein|nr:hypothetical protein [Chlorogloea purpurea SAG 13.99]MDV3000562.1 hypothetical protein [Chroococcopsis gigantea SAG 12.99]